MAIVNGQYVNGAGADPATGAIPGNSDSVGTQQPGVPASVPSVAPASAPTAPSWGSSDPTQSPQYLSFLRSAGFSDAQINANSAKQKTQLQAQLEAQRPIWAQTLQQGLSGVLNNSAGRGTVRSSNRLQGQNQVQQNVSRAQAGYEGDIANQIGNIDAQTQASLASLQQQRAEQALSAQQQVYQSNLSDYQNTLTNQYYNKLLQQVGIN